MPNSDVSWKIHYPFNTWKVVLEFLVFYRLTVNGQDLQPLPCWESPVWGEGYPFSSVHSLFLPWTRYDLSATPPVPHLDNLQNQAYVYLHCICSNICLKVLIEEQNTLLQRHWKMTHFYSSNSTDHLGLIIACFFLFTTHPEWKNWALKSKQIVK